jgi:leucyl-tRNA synthetase
MLFKAPPDFVLEWDTKTIQGSARWLQRLWSLATLCEYRPPHSDAPGPADKDMRAFLHKTIQQVQ